jgi:hypothetical protein
MKLLKTCIIVIELVNLSEKRSSKISPNKQNLKFHKLNFTLIFRAYKILIRDLFASFVSQKMIHSAQKPHHPNLGSLEDRATSPICIYAQGGPSIVFFTWIYPLQHNFKIPFLQLLKTPISRISLF